VEGFQKPGSGPFVTLSVIIITQNESARILECLDSVAFADEIIVLDSGSIDNTVELARGRGARVESTSDWPGFGPQKNRALDLATCEWVLSIDADERVTPELAASIQSAMRQTRILVFQAARLSDFCGRFMRHSGWWPDHVVRLFKRGSARFSDSAVHERVVAEGAVGTLDGHFTHFPYDDLDSVIAKLNRYSSDAAAMMFANGKRASLMSAIGHSLWTFIRIYLLKRGFLDGRNGFVLAVAAGAGSFFRYAKLLFFMGNKKP
jgi:glycosyltransferase involved in cell wall biosynthesis